MKYSIQPLVQTGRGRQGVLAAIPPALAIALMLFVIPTLYADDDNPAAQQCFDAYMESPAAPSCESGLGQTDVFVDLDGVCEISDTCPTHDGQPTRSSIRVPVDDASQVQNCDGILKLVCDVPEDS